MTLLFCRTDATRLIDQGAEQLLLDAMLVLFKEQGWLKERQRQRTDSTHVLAKVRAINRLICVGEAMRFALGTLAIVAGDWVLAHSNQEWLAATGTISRNPASHAASRIVRR
ncbi:hypothetical protein [Reticulibacter mediterranei]|uniref:hypothetical protein n=1 Tax=Reticulibacter mediterranei TaxID=2778369 RepID=UPI001C691743|nr:hypothetical protein [Reticulibacter mediterranei]